MNQKENAQKLKLIYLLHILMEQTDDEHGLTGQELIEALISYGIHIERKTLYSDIALLQDYGVDIIKSFQGKQVYYHIGSREFELAELKLLVDLIQSSKFLTEKKSDQLIHKIESLTSIHEAMQLQRQVYINGRVKSENEKIYYNVDLLHMAINQNVKVEFQYYQWTIDKQKEMRHNGKRYLISPWALSWDNENYYLIGYDEDIKDIRHYRVDKILNLKLTEEARTPQDVIEAFDMVQYVKKIFSMFDGEEQTVRLQVSKDLIGVMIDRFGTDIEITPINDGIAEINVNVIVSPHFLGWILALGDGVQIAGPERVVEDMREMLKKGMERYGDDA